MFLQGALPIQFFRHFCSRMHRLATRQHRRRRHTDRQTDWQTTSSCQ